MNTTNLDITRSQNTACFALFSDRSAQKILLDIYDRFNGERISLRSMVRNASIRASAECGFSSALNQFENKIERTLKNYEIVWEFNGSVYEASNYDGLSAGLAFFTAFTVHLIDDYCKRNPGILRSGPDFAVGATGVLSGATSKAKVEKVAHFQDKLYAALAVLQRGDKLLYPLGNREEINIEMESAFLTAGVELIPVETPVEATIIIISWYLREMDCSCVKSLRRIPAFSRNFFRSRLIMAGAAIAGLLLFLLLCRPFICTPAKVLAALEYGEFDRIMLCKSKESRDPAMQALLQKMRTPLSLTSSFIYLEGNQTLLQEADALNVMQNVVIDSSMGYRFEVQVENSCYYYLIQFSDENAVDLLFPASDFALENHLLTNNQLFLIPGGINYYYFTGAAPRQLVTLCFLGSLWRARDIEELYTDYLEAKQLDELKKIRNRILQRIQKRRRALDRGLQGLYYHQGFFWRQ